MTAAHCAKTLITASTSGSPVLQECTKLLLPGLAEYLIKVAASSDEAAPSEHTMAIIGEIYKAFSSLVVSLNEDLREYIFLFPGEVF